MFCDRKVHLPVQATPTLQVIVSTNGAPLQFPPKLMLIHCLCRYLVGAVVEFDLQDSEQAEKEPYAVKTPKIN